jgi:uncharacterized protein YxjI
MKQKVFSWRDRFAVWDEGERERWYAQGEIFTWGRKLHVYDANGTERAFIRQKLWSFLPRYFIEIGGRTYTVVKEFTFFKPRFRIENTSWSVSGDFWAHEYEIANGNECIMRMSKHWFTWGDSYEFDIPRAENELLALCVALTIDCINADANDAAASAASN